MNYIKALENDIAGKSERLMNYSQFILDLEIYLQSEKFKEINLVNVNDILLRVRELKVKIYS
jgi:hypothetical protein